MLLTSAGRSSAAARRNSRWLTGKRHIHRILADDGGQDAAVGADNVALRQAGTPDLAGDRRNDVGVAQIDLRRLQVGLIGRDGSLRLSLRGDSFVQRLAGANVLRKKILLPLSVFLRQLVLRLARFQCALRLLDGGLEQAFFDAVERCALLYQIALLEQDRLQVSLYSRPDLNSVDRLNPPDKVECLRNWLFFGDDGPHRDRGRGALLRMRGKRKQTNKRRCPYSSAHVALLSRTFPCCIDCCVIVL